MRRRAEFIQATRLGNRVVTPYFVLQTLPKNSKNISKNTAGYALGITASRKVGGAVQRNRAKRRLRALLNKILIKKNDSRENHLRDKPYRIVLVARHKCLKAKFADMQNNLINSLAKDLEQNTNATKV